MVDAPPSIPLPTCMVEAAQIYHIPLRGFLALWLTEGGKPGMKNKNKNGTYDYGAFQINTIWANKLASDFGVKAEQLQHDFCGHCCKVSDEAAFCLIQRPYISKTLLTRRISPRGSP
ncbi:lytic transglycosylase domain-containing protein [Salmonella enterica]|uniref:lytic transglycosylase domain-containing protein n=1 Tax=Salmonella enterica TaxID=28901 RepID=UPI001D16B5AE|nr:lytic transglycosylase domain-containing protein [Salmonella enterica]